MSKIRTTLCASCYAKLNKLYRLREVSAVYQRAGYNKCSLCDFAGQLTEYSYDPESDRRTERERQQMKEREAGARAQRFRRTEEEKQDCMFSAADFDALDDVLRRI